MKNLDDRGLIVNPLAMQSALLTVRLFAISKLQQASGWSASKRATNQPRCTFCSDP